MAAAGVLVELVRGGFAVLHAFVQDGDHVVDVRAVHHDEVLHEEPGGGVPAAVQNSGG